MKDSDCSHDNRKVNHVGSCISEGIEVFFWQRVIGGSKGVLGMSDVSHELSHASSRTNRSVGTPGANLSLTTERFHNVPEATSRSRRTTAVDLDNCRGQILISLAENCFNIQQEDQGRKHNDTIPKHFDTTSSGVFQLQDVCRWMIGTVDLLLGDDE